MPKISLKNWGLDLPEILNMKLQKYSNDNNVDAFGFFSEDSDENLIFQYPEIIIKTPPEYSILIPEDGIELREKYFRGDWPYANGSHSLEVVCQINKLPKSSVTLGRIMGYSGSDRCEICSVNLDQYGHVWACSNGFHSLYDLLQDNDSWSTTIHDGDKIKFYFYVMMNGELVVNINNCVAEHVKKPDEKWKDMKCYFKVGCHVRENDNHIGGCVMKVSSLETAHAVKMENIKLEA